MLRYPQPVQLGPARSAGTEVRPLVPITLVTSDFHAGRDLSVTLLHGIHKHAGRDLSVTHLHDIKLCHV